jgi:hypothetical protein
MIHMAIVKLDNESVRLLQICFGTTEDSAALAESGLGNLLPRRRWKNGWPS